MPIAPSDDSYGRFYQRRIDDWRLVILEPRRRHRRLGKIAYHQNSTSESEQLFVRGVEIPLH